MRVSLFCAIVLAGAAACQQSPPRKIMAVFAHPDDETTVAPILAKYGEISTVYLVIATDGRYGVTDHAAIPAGDSLAAIRLEELKCSCEALGIEPPITLGLHDGLGSFEGQSAMWTQLAMLKDRLATTIDEIDPDVIITFGPDADSGHPDHRLIGIVTTELLLQRPMKRDLYYFSYTREQAALYEGWDLNYADRENLNTKISFTLEDEAKYLQAIECHKTQYSPLEMKEWQEVETSNPENYIYFREYVQSSSQRNSF